MRIKKFITVSTLILFIFLGISGFILITYINSQEMRVVNLLNNPDSVYSETGHDSSGFESSWINYPDAFNFIVFVKDVSSWNTDAMMVVNYAPSKKSISVMSLPRDIVYRTLTTKDKNGNFEKIKINSLYKSEVDKAINAGLDIRTGAENAVRLFESHFKINTKYYVVLDLSIFREVIDQLGGVDFNIPVDLNYDDPTQDLHIHFNKGMQHLTGQKAEEFLRYRYPSDKIYTDELNAIYPGQGSDIDRIAMQQAFLKELIRQKSTFIYYTKISSILDVVYDKVETNIDLNSILDLLKYIPSFNMDAISWYIIPGKIIGNDY
ncbi:MAG: LCP family protein, partial [Clostridia bacterium]|nr:LCP family protein [Clostridia bacterium]